MRKTDEGGYTGYRQAASQEKHESIHMSPLPFPSVTLASPRTLSRAKAINRRRWRSVGTLGLL